MSKGWKIFWWILVILIIIIGIIVYLSKLALDNLSFGAYKWKADLGGLKLQDIPDIILKGEERTIYVDFGMDIINKNPISIPFCYLTATFYYQGVELVKSSETLANKCQRLPKNGVLPITDRITVKLNQAVANLLANKFITGGKPMIEYEIDLTVFGLPIGRILKFLGYPIKNSFPWE